MTANMGCRGTLVALIFNPALDGGKWSTLVLSCFTPAKDRLVPIVLKVTLLSMLYNCSKVLKLLGTSVLTL
jgi:hypothetical protein